MRRMTNIKITRIDGFPIESHSTSASYVEYYELATVTGTALLRTQQRLDGGPLLVLIQDNIEHTFRVAETPAERDLATTLRVYLKTMHSKPVQELGPGRYQVCCNGRTWLVDTHITATGAIDVERTTITSKHSDYKVNLGSDLFGDVMVIINHHRRTKEAAHV